MICNCELTFIATLLMEMKDGKVERQEGGRGRRQREKDEHSLAWKSNEWTKISREAETLGGSGEGSWEYSEPGRSVPSAGSC